MANWFLKRFEGNVQTEVGPLRPSELLKLVRKGEIKPETHLRKDDSAWFEAKLVGGLFEAAVRQDVRYYCPSCNQSIPKPPLTCPNCLRDIGAKEARAVNPTDMSDQPGGNVAPNQPQNEGKKSVQSWLKRKVKRK